MKSTASSTSSAQSAPKRKSRWFFLMNLMIAALVISAVVLLKDSSSHYQPMASFDKAYISLAEAETDPVVLQNGLVRTEAARAHAYRSILRQSHGTFIVGLIIAIAFVANSIFIYRLTRKQNQTLTEGAAV